MIKNTVLKWCVSTIAVLATAYLLPGVSVDNLLTAFIAALVIGFINSFIRPILLVLTLPFNFATLGLFTFVLNALLILLAGKIVPGFYIDNFWSALSFSVVLWLANSILKVREDRVIAKQAGRIHVKSEVVEE